MNSKIIIALSFALSSALVFAGTSDYLYLKGKVQGVNDIKVEATTDASNLSITGGAANLKVAKVTEKSNDRLGYDITMLSSNAGNLIHTQDNTQKTSYQLSYDGGPFITPSTTPTTIKTISSLTGLTTTDRDVLINLTAAPNAVAGDYEDTVTFSIVAH